MAPERQEGGQVKEGGVGLQKGRGCLFEGQKGAECGQFHSRVDGMVGEGEGRVHCDNH